MECPYCKKEMTYGYIEGDNIRRLNWKMHEKKNLLEKIKESLFDCNGIELFDGYQNGRNAVNSHCCKVCKKIIIEIKDENDE